MSRVKKKERACDGHCRPGASLASSGFSRELGQRSHLTSPISKNVERERDVCNHNGAAKTEGSVPTRKNGTKQKKLKILEYISPHDAVIEAIKNKLSPKDED